MTPLDPKVTLARRELVLVATILVVVTRLVERPDAFLVAGLLPVVILLAGSSVLLPAGLGLVPAVAAFAFGLDRVLMLELRLLTQASGTTDADRARILAAAVITAFVAFTGMAALVPGGLPEPGTTPADLGLSEAWLLVLALDDALIALILGYRVASVRYGSARDAIRSAVTYAIVIAVAAGALRALDVPRLVGPAALTLVFYLWDALHATAPARRREPRFLWETILLAALAIVVVAWNLRLRA